MQCQDCRWWFQTIPEHQQLNIGLCKRFPPAWADQSTCAFPVIESHNVCGEWSAKAPEDTSSADA